MKPETIGRALGIGLRVAGRVAGQRIAGNAQAGSSQPAQQSAAAASQPRNRGQSANQVSRSAARGVGGFFRPLRRVGGILWLEVTGVFFCLFALVFGTAMWRVRPASLHGPYHKPFLTTAAMMMVFLYLGVTSFLKARSK
jgi:hypothetical protein